MSTACIITLQGDNFGATLQAVALNYIVNSYGITTENLDYNDIYRVKQGLTGFQKIKNSIWKNVMVRLIAGEKRKKSFDQFREKYLPLSDKSWNSKEKLMSNPPDYDVYISGSDQIWNPNVNQGDYNYLLAFVPDGKRKISYASSFGKKSLEKHLWNEYKNFLMRYDAIGVRETSGVDIIRTIAGLQAETVLDPTLLLDQNQWRLMSGCTNEKEPYILTYYMPGDKKVCKAIASIAKKLSQKTNLHIINLGQREYYRLLPWIDSRVTAGPAEFLNLFLNASYIITNSFHGTAFATNFHKPLCVPINGCLDNQTARHTRIVDYLHLIGLDNAIVTVDRDGQYTQPAFPHNYTKVSQRLCEKRNESLEFLVNAIGL